MDTEKIKSFLYITGRSISDLIVWLFASFLLPIIQLFVLLFLKEQTFSMSASMYNILFVTIASFLTNVFFFTEFWKKRNNWLRMALIISYVLALTLFIISLLEIVLKIEIFDLKTYSSGMLISLSLAIIVGFSSKFDEIRSQALDIARQGKEKNEVNIDGEEIEL